MIGSNSVVCLSQKPLRHAAFDRGWLVGWLRWSESQQSLGTVLQEATSKRPYIHVTFPPSVMVLRLRRKAFLFSR